MCEIGLYKDSYYSNCQKYTLYKAGDSLKKIDESVEMVNSISSKYNGIYSFSIEGLFQIEVDLLRSVLSWTKS